MTTGRQARVSWVCLWLVHFYLSFLPPLVCILQACIYSAFHLCHFLHVGPPLIPSELIRYLPVTYLAILHRSQLDTLLQYFYECVDLDTSCIMFGEVYSFDPSPCNAVLNEVQKFCRLYSALSDATGSMMETTSLHEVGLLVLMGHSLLSSLASNTVCVRESVSE